MLYTITEPPAAEPVTLSEAKAHLRILHTSEDELVGRLISAARTHVEHVTGRALIRRTIAYHLAAFPAARHIPLPFPPLTAVTGITYLDPVGAEQTLPAETYQVIEDIMGGYVALLPGAAWPSTASREKAVTVTYVAGYSGTGEGIPEDLRNALLMLVEHFYFNRGATSDARVETVPFAVEALLSPYRTFGWA